MPVLSLAISLLKMRVVGWWLLAGMMASSAVTAACESEKSEKEEEGIVDRAKVGLMMSGHMRRPMCSDRIP